MAKRTTSILAVALVLCVGAPAQTLKEYLAMRKKNHIAQASGVEALEAFLGLRVVEVQGVVKGSFAMNGVTTYLVERPDGGTINVNAPRAVEWLMGNEVHARLLVKASRETETSELKAELLGAAPEAEIARIEWSNRPKITTKIANPNPKGGPLYGPIGKGGGSSKPPKNWNLPTDEALPIYARFIKNYNKRLSDAQAIEIAQGVIGFSIKFGVDARLIMAMVLVESSFNPNDTSHVGAMGLGQLMPGTARELGVTNAYDTMQNLYGTTKLVRQHIEKYSRQTGNDFEALVLALAAYNAGPGAVSRHKGIPPYAQTQRYVQKVIAAYRSFCGG